MPKTVNPLVLIILDGWGYSEETQWNAIHSACKPNWDRYWAQCPHTLINCSGGDVGLPAEQMGNSEVGHMHIGAGRLVPQEFTRIANAIEDGSFFENPAATGPLRTAAANHRAVHILGLTSPGGVHSHEQQILAMMELAARSGIQDLYVHTFLDGRDTPPRSAAGSLALIETRAEQLGVGRIVSIIGRYYAMDRNRHWERTRQAYDLIIDGKAAITVNDPLSALEQAYERGENDEFVKPIAIVRNGAEPVRVNDGDVMVFMNFRADRARQLTRAITDRDFSEFSRQRIPKLESFITLTEYSAEFTVPVMFPPVPLKNSLGDYLATRGCTQLRIAETEKYAHVTFFFNGGEEKVFPNEDRILVPSPRVATYDLVPEMSAAEVTDGVVAALEKKHYDAIICNFANPDMVGHTGDFDATVRAIETVDSCLGRIETAARAVGAEVLITADHGNAERMRSAGTKEAPGQAHTAHTTNLVPLVYIGRPAEVSRSGTLVDIAPTVLTLMGIEAPPEMTGHSLLQLTPQSESENLDAAGAPRARAMQ